MTTQLYTATVTATPGAIKSDDGTLALDVHEPTELNGPGGATNPEQLMAAALASCLLESLRIALGTVGGSIDGVSVDGKVTLTDSDNSGYSAQYSLRATIPGVDNPEDVLKQAASICPFVETVNGIDVQLAD